MHNLCIVMHAMDIIFIKGAHHLTKASCETSARSLKDFLSKGEKNAKNILPKFKVFQMTAGTLLGKPRIQN